MKSHIPDFISIEDRIAADVFQKSYREFLEIKPTHYRWFELAPQSIRHLQVAEEKHWSMEKIADYLHCELEEAIACQRRFTVSKKVNSKDTTAARIREGFFQWIGGIVDMDEKGRQALADELAKLVANQLYTAALAKEDLLKLSNDLEGNSDKAPEAKPSAPQDSSPSKWGPQWKD
jgi:hypothetical protein